MTINGDFPCLSSASHSRILRTDPCDSLDGCVRSACCPPVRMWRDEGQEERQLAGVGLVFVCLAQREEAQASQRPFTAPSCSPKVNVASTCHSGDTKARRIPSHCAAQVCASASCSWIPSNRPELHNHSFNQELPQSWNRICMRMPSSLPRDKTVYLEDAWSGKLATPAHGFGIMA